MKLKNLVYTRFKNYNDALKTWGISQEEIDQKRVDDRRSAVEVRATHNFYPTYDKETLTREITDFISKKQRLPTWKEAERAGLPSRGVFKRVFGTHNKKELNTIFAL
jgi:DNA mismatch repair ATPase MutL